MPITSDRWTSVIAVTLISVIALQNAAGSITPTPVQPYAPSVSARGFFQSQALAGLGLWQEKITPFQKFITPLRKTAATAAIGSLLFFGLKSPAPLMAATEPVTAIIDLSVSNLFFAYFEAFIPFTLFAAIFFVLNFVGKRNKPRGLLTRLTTEFPLIGELSKHGTLLRRSFVGLSVAFLGNLLIQGVRFTLKNGVPIVHWPHISGSFDVIGLVLNVVLLELVTLSVATGSFMFRAPAETLKTWVLRPWAIPLFSIFGLVSTYVVSIIWTLSNGLQVIPIAVYMMVIGVVIIVTPLVFSAIMGKLRFNSYGQLVRNGLIAIGMAIVLVLPMAFIEEWGHYVATHLLYISPAPLPGTSSEPLRDTIHLFSLFEAEFRPAKDLIFAPLFDAWRNFSQDQIAVFKAAGGPIVTWIYAAVLLILGSLTRRWPRVRRGFQLGALIVGFMAQQYLRGSAGFSRDTDWSTIWSLASPAVKWMMNLSGFLIAYAIVIYRGVTEWNGWYRQRSVSKALVTELIVPQKQISRFSLRALKHVLGLASAPTVMVATFVFHNLYPDNALLMMALNVLIVLSWGVFAMTVLRAPELERLQNVEAALKPETFDHRDYFIAVKHALHAVSENQRLVPWAARRFMELWNLPEQKKISPGMVAFVSKELHDLGLEFPEVSPMVQQHFARLPSLSA